MTATSFFRRSIVTTAASAVAVAGLAFSPIANADTTDAAVAKFGPCGNVKDNDEIWESVKHVSPLLKEGSLDVVFPGGDRSMGWAVRHGNQKTKSNTDLLVIPTARETGIECPDLLEGNAPHYFKSGYDDRALMGASDWALGLNSKDGRTRNQLHIHLAPLYGPARTDIDKAVKAGKVTKNEKDWVNSTIEVTGHDMQGKDTKHVYRAWNADSIDYNFFIKLNDDIVKPLAKQGKPAAMEHEALLITQNHAGNGFIVLASDRNTGIHGTDNIETILNKG